MQFKVPQNIDKEDKILGPLTFVQFIYVLLGGGFILLYYSVFDIPLFIILSIPTAALTAAFALIKIQDQPFSRFFLAFLLFLKSPKRRMWADAESTEDRKIADSLFSDPEASKKQTAFQALISKKDKTRSKTQLPVTKATRATSGQPTSPQPTKVTPVASPSVAARKVPVTLISQGGN